MIIKIDVEMAFKSENGTKFNVVGNSLTWRYTVDEENGEVKFFRFRNGKMVFEGNGPKVHVGDTVWFRTNGSETEWDIAKLPKNPLRCAFWEAGENSNRDIFHFNCDDKELEEEKRHGIEAFHESRKFATRLFSESCWFTEDSFSVKQNGKIVAVVNLSRDWNHQYWRIYSVYVRNGYASRAVGEAILGELNNMRKAVYITGKEVEI